MKINQFEQLQTKYEMALERLQSAEKAFDGSPAGIAWVKEATAALVEIQNQLAKLPQQN